MATNDLYISEPDDTHNRKQKGKLKIFFGIMPGAGKTSAMLRAAQAEVANGRKVVVSIVTWQTCPEAMALMEGLMVVPPKTMEYNGVLYKEMNLKAILKIRPDIVLVTDPAHTNAPGSRHLKRYHDMQELLDNGINLYSTLNMVQLESLSGFFQEITGLVAPMVPDKFFAQTDEVELVDIGPGELVRRFREGKVYVSWFPDEEIENIYQEEKITTIRKKFFQMAIDRENWHKQHINWPSKIETRLLVLIWPDAVTPGVLRRAAAMSAVIDADWIALHLETGCKRNDWEKTQLGNNIKLARQLGATLITYTGDELVEALVEVAHRERVSHILLGKTIRGQIACCPEKSFLKRLLKYTEHINISIICGETPQNERKWSFNITKPIPGFRNKGLTILAALITGVLCTLLDNKTGSDAPPYVVMLLLFMLAAPMHASFGLIAASLLLLACIILALPPMFVLPFDLSSDILSLLLYSLFSLLNGFLTVRMRTQERETFRHEKQTNALFQLTKKLSEATTPKEIVTTSMENLLRYFDVPVFFIFRDADYQLSNIKYVPKGITLSEKDLEIAAWSSKHGKPAGKFTDVMPSGEYSYYPLTGKGVTMGVLVAKQEKSFSGKDDISWDAFLSQIIQSLERQYLEITARRTNLLNESEKLYKTLFNSISHELRIPISAIMGASDLLLASQHPEHVRTELYSEILDSSQRLNRLVENLLNMSRLESGRIAAHPNWCDILDLFNRVVKNLEDDLKPFHVEITVPESMPLVYVDYGLLEQAIYNLVYNATLYAPAETDISMNACYDNGFLVVQIADKGPGFDSASLKHIFNKFWRPQGEKPGGLGLGLSIVKGFVEAHNGTIYAENAKSGGAQFTIMILTEKSDYDTHKTENIYDENFELNLLQPEM